MDTKLKKSKGSFLKALCIFIIIASMMAGSYLSFIRVENLWRAGATYEAFRDAINYGTVGNMQERAFNAQLENFQMDLYSLVEFEGGTKEKYNEISDRYSGAVNNLKTDITIHLRDDIYETNRTGGVEGTRGLFELYERGYIQLVPLYSETADVGRYVAYQNEFSHWEMEEGEYIEMFIDEPESYFDGTWDDYHKNSGTINTYYEGFPEEIKKLSIEKGCDFTVCMNTLIYSEDYEDNYIEHTTMHPATNAEGQFYLYDDAPTQYYGFYGVKFNMEKLQSALYSMPYGSFEQYRGSYESAKARLDSYNSAYYAIVIDNKVVSTNIKGITATSTANEIRSALSKCDVQMNWIKNDWEVEKDDIIVSTYHEMQNNAYVYVGINPFGGKATANTVFAPKLTAEYGTQVQLFINAFNDIVLYVGACCIIYLLMMLILIIKSGRRKNDDEIHLAPFDKIWVEIRTAIDGAIIFYGGLLLMEGYYSLNSNGYMFLKKVIMMALVVAIVLAVTDYILYLTRNIKNRSIASRFMIVWIFEKLIKGTLNFIRTNKNRLSEKIKAILRKYIYVGDVEAEVKRKTLILVILNVVVGIVALLCFASRAFMSGCVTLFVLFLFDCYILLRGLRFVGAVKRLFRVTGEIRKGEENAKVDYTAIPTAFHETADNLMGIKDGIKAAVDKAMQNEKMKTELITNVSHDLKTPLTSIINYVDLLQKCDIQDETAQSYLAVLSEKSDRLKHLIEDLVEASKASSGAVNVNTVSVSVTEFINQLTGEHGEGLAEKNLDVIVTLPDEDIVVKADSNLLYRVLENLVVNVKKYAMEHTRVYISAQKSGTVAKITIKNISAAPLNMTPEELKSRFVRGDESRSTSGNGLGLSIAENLCNLMKGKLDLSIDGDLFTATVEMPIE